MPSMNVLTTIYVTGYALVQDALTVRETPGSTLVERSPYSPPVRYLAEEKPPENSYDDVTVSLVRARIHSGNLVTLTFKASREVQINPSQNIVLDLTSFLRGHSHTLVDWTEDESTVNDDCVRTWTVSIPPTAASPCLFSITMRTITGGLITPILYKIASRYAQDGESADLASLKVTAPLRGIGGTLPVPEPIAACDGGRSLLWIAGGIGLTPFLSLTRHVARHVSRTFGVWDIALVLSTREPDVMLRLIADALNALPATTAPPDLSYVLHIFSPVSPKSVDALPAFVTVHQHLGRIGDDGEVFTGVGAKDREVQICGPLPFVQNAMKALECAGVDPEQVKRERFTY
ncbi:hypothetical protein BDZ94DRAFT_1269323 [Collybia nuda]|uniref:Ferric reductase NAD binding domain-containing protein n=1 Tax=Collybia nuda TaxID=64659 RepID=A0A9P6CEA8_9AGAR|nr:hypothetical protein BDZ94DRAFT_1269323 [Collybia nuda]